MQYQPCVVDGVCQPWEDNAVCPSDCPAPTTTTTVTLPPATTTTIAAPAPTTTTVPVVINASPLTGAFTAMAASAQSNSYLLLLLVLAVIASLAAVWMKFFRKHPD